MVHGVDRFEQIGTQVEQGQQTTTQRDEVITELTRRESTLMQCMIRVDRHLTDLERIPPGPHKGDMKMEAKSLSSGSCKMFIEAKVIQVSDAKVAARISIGEIGPRVFAVEGQVHVMVSQMVHGVDRFEQIGTQVEQGQQTTTQRDEVITELTR
nr:hypothetical protein [Tanacetum cinerariifolium]